MRIAILSESPHDELAIRILAEAILERHVEPISRRRRPGGWPQVRKQLPPVVKQAFYHDEAEIVVAVVDGDRSPVHKPNTAPSGRCEPRCRACELAELARQVCSQLTLRPERAPIVCATAVAYPAIEAWLFYGEEGSCTESHWQQQPLVSAPQVIRRLKQRIYGSDRVVGERQIKMVEHHARRVASRLRELEAAFPAGFGMLAKSLRDWNRTREP